MTVTFNTYEGKNLPEKTYTNVIAVWFDDETWTIKIRYNNGKINYTLLDLEDYCLTYVHT